jgi:putative transposase
MGRPRRIDVGGYAYHVLNRSVRRRRIFRKDGDFATFERVLGEAVERSAGGVKLLAYCVMGDHWHLVIHTKADGELSPFMKWLTLTHTQRYQAAHRSVGDGPLYQGRFKSFVIQKGPHLLTVCRYVEGHAARAMLVNRAEDWRWSSLWRWRHAGEVEGDAPMVLSHWPVPGGRPRQWLRTVNTPLKRSQLEALAASTNRSRPYGSQAWVTGRVAAFNLESCLRRPGRPRSPR